MTSLNRWLIVIPARLNSTRLPRKLLMDIGGKPLIARAYDTTSDMRACGARVVVATDSHEIKDVCQTLSIDSEITAESHVSGTDRCAEVAAKYACEFIMNVQGDEPFLEPSDLTSLAKFFEKNSRYDIATLAAPCTDRNKFSDSNIVKIVVGQNQKALYFSRAAIPHVQNIDTPILFWFHIGVYAFRKNSLARFIELKPSTLELRENLEQLRALENGMNIGVSYAKSPSLNINTLSDLNDARKAFQ